MKLKLVFYMPNEEIFKKDDLSRELGLVLQVIVTERWDILCFGSMSNRKNSENLSDFSLMSLSDRNRDLVTLWRKKKWRESSVMMYEVVGFVFVVLSSNLFGIFSSKRHTEIFLTDILKYFWQVPNVAPILGELAFFIGIPQPATVRARWVVLNYLVQTHKIQMFLFSIWVYLTIYTFSDQTVMCNCLFYLVRKAMSSSTIILSRWIPNFDIISSLCKLLHVSIRSLCTLLLHFLLVLLMKSGELVR